MMSKWTEYHANPSQAQAQFVERRTHEEFQELHNFLEEMERANIELLKKEEEEKSRTVKRLMDDVEVNISSLSDAITALEEQVALDAIPLLLVRLFSYLILFSWSFRVCIRIVS